MEDLTRGIDRILDLMTAKDDFVSGRGKIARAGESNPWRAPLRLQKLRLSLHTQLHLKVIKVDLASAEGTCAFTLVHL